MTDSKLKPSGRNNPCPVCGRTKDGDCRIGSDLVLCHKNVGHKPGKYIQNGWAYTGDASDERCGVFVPDKPLDRPQMPTQGAENVWRYSDNYYVCRFPGKQIRPLSWDGNRWQWKIPPGPRPLLNQEMLRASPNAPVVVVEGEKTADAAQKLMPGAVVTTWPSGCKAASKANFEILKGRRVVLWPDADEPGINAMNQVAKILQRIGAESIDIVEPPTDVTAGWDLADAKGWTSKQVETHLEEHCHSYSEPQATSKTTDINESDGEDEESTYTEILQALLSATVSGDDDAAMPLRAELITRFRVTGAQVESALFQLQIQRESQRKTTTPPPSLDLSRISGMDYLVDGFIIENDQNLIWGAAGTGKTTNAIGLAKAVIYGERFLDHDKAARRGAVLFIASDSGPAPLKGAIQDFGLAEDPEFNEGPSKRFHVWASDQDQGMAAWSADLRGCIRLLNFIREFGISLVIIDSCKAVLAGTDIEYTDNRGVTALMTFFKEVICPHTTVVWLNHDGAKVRGGDCPAGAKAWKEIPSAVHTIEVPRDEETKQPVKTHRKWIVQKNRLGETREFLYRFGDGELSVLHGQTTYGNCLAELVEGMATKFRESGLETSSKQDLYRMCPNHAAKTVSNTLVTAARAKHPEICRRGRGLYALSPKFLESLRSVNPEVGRNFSKSKSETTISEIPSSSQPQNSGTSRDKREIPTIPDESHREKDGKTEINVRQGDFKEFIPAGHTHLIAPSSSPAQIGSGADAMADEGDDPHWGPRGG